MDSSILNTTKDILPILTTLTAIVAVFANLWLFSQLAPLTLEDAIIVKRIEAIERLNAVPRAEISVQFQSIQDRLDRIERKIDRL